MPVLDNSAEQPRHVLMTADTAGGVWTYALELCEILSRWNIGVSLATMGPPVTARHRSEARKLSNVELFESHYKLEWMDQAEQDFEPAGDWLLRLADRIHPDIVHLNGYSHAALDWEAPTMVVAHSCVLSWYEAVRGAKPGLGFDTYRERVRRGLEKAHVVAAPSHAMLRQIERLYGSLPCAVVIPNGRNEHRFSPGEKAEFILATGRLWDEAKNLGMLDAMAPALPWPVYLAGEALHPNGTLASVRHARHLGALSADELRPWFSRAAIYASPARYEPFGLSVLEAALSGCALVLGDIPSLRENWEGVALFSPPNDPDRFESVLGALTRDVLKRKQLAGLAQERAQRFSPSAMARGYLNAYKTAGSRFSGRKLWQGAARIA